MEEHEANVINRNEIQIHNTTSSINSELGKLLIQDDDNNKKDVEENEVNVNNSNELQMLNTTISHINDDFYYSEGENDSLYSNESNNKSTKVERNEESNSEEEEYDDNNNDNEFLGKKRKL